MSQLFTCGHGHQWTALAVTRPGLPPPAAACPECGAAGAPTASSDLLTGPILPDDLPPVPRAVPPTAARPHGHEAGPAPAGYEILGELGRGGMGVVLKGRDTDLGRDVAVKVLLETHRGRAELERRFVEEAQIAGQLQHPGVVPVYEMGQFPDRRPYFTMKLVRGRTLEELLEERGAGAPPAAELTRWLGIFEPVCQALAYAHARRVIHRDLKPSNVMVGAFGEVQVMDWGLAKVLKDGGADEGSEPARATVIHTARSGLGVADQDSTATQAGSVLGTPAYMAPEQARGEVAGLDERCDVFGLGAILCRILTGQPPFVGSGEGALARARAGAVGDAFARLDGCGADTELIALAKGCLSAEPGGRPRDASVVAAALGAYLGSVAARLRRAELERAQAEARAEEAKATAAAERKARRRTRALATAVLALVAVGAGGGLWVQHQAAERQADRARRDAEQRQTVASALEKASALRQQARWREAEAVLEQARRGLGEGGPADLRQRLDVAQAELALINRLDTIRERVATTVEGKFDMRTYERDYAAAFREAGLGEVGDDETAVAARVRASAVSGQLVAALDDWALEAEPKSSSWLLGVARRADPDPWRDRFRDPAVRGDRQALQALADDALRDAGAQVDALSPQALGSLGVLLLRGGADAVPLLRAAQRRYPSDFWLSFVLGNALHMAKNTEEAVGYFRAAVALRPDASVAHYSLGAALLAKKDLDGAIAAFRTAIDIDPKYAPAHYDLGLALIHKKDLDGAIAAFRTATDLEPKSAPAHSDLGNALRENKDLEGAIAECRTAIDLDPKLALAHHNLGAALYDKKDLDGAVAAFRQAIDSDPKLGVALNGLGVALLDKKDVDGAIAAYRQALDSDPKYAIAHYNLGNALRGKQDLDGAIAEYRKAIDSDPTLAAAHHNLGNALRDKKDLDGAIAAYRKAIDLDPKLAQAHGMLGALGQALLQQGRFGEARTAARRHLDLLPERDPIRRFVAQQLLTQCERLVALDEKLSAVLSGEAEPAGAAERIALGQLCQQYKHRHAAAARFYTDAFAADPKLAADLRHPYRFNAACSATLAAAGQAEDAKDLPDKVQRMLRRQALDWLRADLALYAQLAERAEPAAKQVVRQMLAHWQEDTDLVTVRDKEALDKLPDDERRQWRALWDEVAVLLKKVAV